jgi:hypothetical protein
MSNSKICIATSKSLDYGAELINNKNNEFLNKSLISNTTMELIVVSPKCSNSFGTNDPTVIEFYKTVLFNDCIQSLQYVTSGFAPYAIFKSIDYRINGAKRDNFDANKNVLEVCKTVRNIDDKNYFDMLNNKYTFITYKNNDTNWNLAFINTQYNSAAYNKHTLYIMIMLCFNILISGVFANVPAGYGLFNTGSNEMTLYNDAWSPSEWTQQLCWDKCGENFCDDKDTKWTVNEYHVESWEYRNLFCNTFYYLLNRLRDSREPYDLCSMLEDVTPPDVKNLTINDILNPPDGFYVIKHNNSFTEGVVPEGCTRAWFYPIPLKMAWRIKRKSNDDIYRWVTVTTDDQSDPEGPCDDDLFATAMQDFFQAIPMVNFVVALGCRLL